MKPKKLETRLGFVILLVLIGIAGGLFLKQSQYDEKLFKAALSRNQPTANTESVAAPDLRDYLTDGMVVLSTGEAFGPETLSEKIDGKAELYLSAGFLNLHAQRFAESGNPGHWVELFIYDMGNRENAFSVFSTQRRADAQVIPLTHSAYRTENALFFQQGQYYVEIIAASDGMQERLQAMGERFVRLHPSSAEGPSETGLFPKTALLPESIALLAENVFGFDRLSHTYIGRYEISGTELTAFISPQQSVEAAREMASAYHQFLLANGGEDVTLRLPLSDAYLVKIFDTFELVFVHKATFAGVHEAERQDLAEGLAMNLNEALSQPKSGESGQQ